MIFHLREGSRLWTWSTGCRCWPRPFNDKGPRPLRKQKSNDVVVLLELAGQHAALLTNNHLPDDTFEPIFLYHTQP